MPMPQVGSSISHRLKAVGARWGSVISCGIIAGVAWWVSAPFIELWIAPLTQRLFVVHPALLILATGLLCGPFVWSRAAGRWAGFLGLRYIHTFPPLWVSVFVSLAVAVGLNRISSVSVPLTIATATLANHIGELLGVAAAVIVGVATLVIIARAAKQERSGRNESSGADAIGDATRFQDFEAIIRWIKDDREIDHPGLDAFGHSSVAQRIVRRLTSPDGEEAPTIAVVGRIGSGKTSIGRLVKHYLSAYSNHCFVSVSLWPFQTPEAAVHGILSALIRELSKRVNILAIRGLSDQYITVVEQAGGPWSALLRLARPVQSPDELLTRVSRILAAIDVRIVLWVEDLERFAGSGRLSSEAAAIRDAEVLDPIRALLHLLDRSERVSVIVADATLQTRFDLDKIARFVERPPTVTPEQAWTIVSRIRNHALSGWPKDVLDPVRKEVREEFAKLDSVTLSVLQRMRYDRTPQTCEAFLMLLQTPRSLKAPLRLAVDVWDCLAGEIDFDHVLVMAALRTAEPDVFDFVNQHINWFRDGFHEHMNERSSTEHPVWKEFVDNVLKSQTVDRQSAILSMIGYVFPASPKEHYAHDAERDYIERPQGLNVDRHTSYWDRFLSVPSVPEPESDQTALQDIARWRVGTDNDLVRRVADDKRSYQVETFLRQFRPSELCKLLEEVCQLVTSLQVNEWHGGDFIPSPPGVIPVWRMMLRVRPDEQVVADCVEKLVRQLVSVNLALAHNIFYHFAAARSPTVEALVSSEHERELRVLFRAELVSSFPVGAERKLMDALSGGSAYLLNWIFYALCHDEDDRQPRALFEGQQGFCSVLLDAAEAFPDEALPQVVEIVTTGGHVNAEVFDERTETYKRSMQFEAKFDETEAKRVFDFERLIDLLAIAKKPVGLDGQAALAFEVATEYARKVRRIP